MKTALLVGFFVLIALGLINFRWPQPPLPAGAEDLKGNEAQIAQQMIEVIEKLTKKRQAEQGGPLPRLNQVKSLGCFDGRFVVSDSLPETLQRGLFAHPGEYPAFARFANASQQDDGKADLRGLSIQVIHDLGENLLGVQGRQDFLLNSYPVLFADTPETFLAFIKAQYNDNLLGFFLNPLDTHLQALSILLRARGRPSSPFDIPYWSTTAYRFGEQDRAVKYSVESCSSFQSAEPESHNENYLSQAMAAHLELESVCLAFKLQLQTHPKQMPVEDPSVFWDESLSPFVEVARLYLPPQDFRSPTKMASCDASQFNPWHALPEHRPLGRMNAVRRQVYLHMSALRQDSVE